LHHLGRHGTTKANREEVVKIILVETGMFFGRVREPIEAMVSFCRVSVPVIS